MECNNCGNKYAYRLSINAYSERCNECGKIGSIWFPDVFWNGKPEITLADVNGTSPIFSSKIEKAIYLKTHGLQEAGDKVRGSFVHYDGKSKLIDKLQNREEVKKVLHMVKNMGKEYKRQEFARIKAKSKGVILCPGM